MSVGHRGQRGRLADVVAPAAQGMQAGSLQIGLSPLLIRMAGDHGRVQPSPVTPSSVLSATAMPGKPPRRVGFAAAVIRASARPPLATISSSARQQAATEATGRDSPPDRP